MRRSKPVGFSFVQGPAYSSHPDSSSEWLEVAAEEEADVGPAGLVSGVDTPPERTGPVEIASWPQRCSPRFSPTHVSTKNDLRLTP